MPRPSPRGSAPSSSSTSASPRRRSSSTGTRSTSPAPARRPIRSPGALPEVEPAAHVEADLARRDFTINAMAIPLRGEPRLIDPHGGRDGPRGRAAARPPRALLRRRPDPRDPRRPLRGALRLRARAGDRGAAVGGRPGHHLRRPPRGRAAAPRGGSRGPAGLRPARGVGPGRAADGRRRAGAPASPSCSRAPWSGVAPRATRALLAAALGPPGGEDELAPARARARPRRRSSWPTRREPGRAGPRPGAGRRVARPLPGRVARRCALEIDGADLIAAGVPRARRSAAACGRRCGASSTARSRAASRSWRSALGGRAGATMEWREEGRRALAGGASCRAGPLHDPPRRGQRRPSTASTSASSPRTTAAPSSRTAAGCGALGLDAGSVSIGRQVHGAELAFHAAAAPSPVRARPDEIPEVDGHVAATGLAALVFVADCLPVALAGPAAWRCCTAAGAAWQPGSSPRGRGRRRDRRRDRPGIGPCCYEVGDRGPRCLRRLGDGIADGRMLDLRRGRAAAAARGGGRAGRVRRPLHQLRAGALLLPPPRRRPHRPPGRAGLARRRKADVPGLIHGLDPAKIAANLERVRELAGPEVEILAATKYVPLEEMGALAEAGVTLVGENRQQDLAAKHERWGDAFEWDFIGNLQSRKVKQLLPRLPPDPLGRHRLGPASSSAATAIRRPRSWSRSTSPARRARAASHPAELAAFIERCPVRVVGPDDDAPVQPGPGGLAAPLRPPRRARRRARPRSASRWAPLRTGRSRSRRARRSSAWAPRCSCESALTSRHNP